MVEVLGAKYFDSEDIIKMLKEKYKKQQFDYLGNISILSASFVVTTNDMLKEPNEEYIQRELEWYLSESLNVNDIPGKTPKIWEQVSDKDGFINSNYGWTTFSKENYSQFDKVLEELSKNNKYSRQGVIIFIRPTMHEDSKRNGMHDFICTYCYNFKIERDIDGIDKLYMMVNMRSNDCVFGYLNDKGFADYVFNRMLNELQKTYPELQKGVMFWKADNFHVYPRHFKYLEETIEEE